jgi:hypothetical protein
VNIYFGKSIIIFWNPIEHTDSQPCTRPPSWGHDGTWRTRESSILQNLARLTTNSHNAIGQSNDRMNLQWELLFFFDGSLGNSAKVLDKV